MTKILVDKKNFKQKLVQYPINLPPNKTTFCGKKNAGKKIIEIIIIPIKKKIENIYFLIIFIKIYTKSLYLCLFLIILLPALKIPYPIPENIAIVINMDTNAVR